MLLSKDGWFHIKTNVSNNVFRHVKLQLSLISKRNNFRDKEKHHILDFLDLITFSGRRSSVQTDWIWGHSCIWMQRLLHLCRPQQHQVNCYGLLTLPNSWVHQPFLILPGPIAIDTLLILGLASREETWKLIVCRSAQEVF